jgi:DNA-binding transcriptional ArsR family regulator
VARSSEAKSNGAAARLAESAPVFAALADRTRLRIVVRLSETGGLSTSRLTSGTRMSRQAVSKHLDTLAEAGLVRSRRSGRERLWDLETERLARVSRDLEQISKQWDAALARLRKLVE